MRKARAKAAKEKAQRAEKAQTEKEKKLDGKAKAKKEKLLEGKEKSNESNEKGGDKEGHGKTTAQGKAKEPRPGRQIDLSNHPYRNP